MNDERFERDLTVVLRDIAGAEAPASLRYRLSTITEAPTAGRRSWFAPLLQLSAAAVVIVAVAAFGWVFLQAPIVGPNPTPTPGPSPSATAPAPSASPSPSPSESPGPSETPGPSEPTGLVWSDGVAPALSGAAIVDMVAWHDGYVAIGASNMPENATGRGLFLASADGVRWSITQEVDLRPNESLVRILAVGDRLLAVTHVTSVFCPAGTPSPCPSAPLTPGLWMSSDGSDWTAVDSPSWSAILGWSIPQWMVSGDAGLVAVGYEGHPPVDDPAELASVPSVPLILHSDDGITWQQADLTQGFDHAVFRDVVAYPGGFVVVGRDGVRDPLSDVVDPSNPTPLGLGRPAAWVSADGIHWSAADVDGIEIAGGELSRVEAGAQGLFAIGVGSPASGDATPSGWSSTDGRSWHVVGRLGGSVPSIDQGVHEPGYTVLTSDGDHIVVLDRAAPTSETMAAWTSTDGVTWRRLAFSGSTDLPKIGDYSAAGAQGTYVTGGWVLPDRIVVAGHGATPTRLWLALANWP